MFRSRMSIFKPHAFILALLMCSVNGYSSELLVNESSNTHEISAPKLKSILLGSTTAWGNGQHIALCFFSSDKPEIESMVRRYTGKNLRSFKRHWTKKIFSGNASSMPLFYKRESKAMLFVESKDGALCIGSPKDVSLPKSVLKLVIQ